MARLPNLLPPRHLRGSLPHSSWSPLDPGSPERLAGRHLRCSPPPHTTLFSLPDADYKLSLYRDLLFWLLSIFPLELQCHKGRALVLPWDQYLAPSRCSLRGADRRRRAEAAGLPPAARPRQVWGEEAGPGVVGSKPSTVCQEAQQNSDSSTPKRKSENKEGFRDKVVWE